MKKLLLFCAIFAGTITMYSQAQTSKPLVIMVVPSDAWCVDNGYVESFENQGVDRVIPDYRRALTDINLEQVLAKIGSLMIDRGIKLQPLQEALTLLDQHNAEDNATASKTTGAKVKDDLLNELLQTARADITIKVSWSVNVSGPYKSITYTLDARDAYTGLQVAVSTGTGERSAAADIPSLIEEAVIENIDFFTRQLKDHFDDISRNGREISFRIRAFENEDGFDLETEYEGVELSEIINDWVAQNTVNNMYNLLTATESELLYNRVRIPLYAENGMPMDARAFVKNLQKYLKGAPFNLTSKVEGMGLGSARCIIGGK